MMAKIFGNCVPPVKIGRLLCLEKVSRLFFDMALR